MALFLRSAVTTPADEHAWLRRSVLEYWHLLSLDAPTVAALWTWFIGRTSHVPLPVTTPLTMFLAVWILYAIDRLLDTRGREEVVTRDLEARHRFHRRHDREFIGVAVIAMSVLIVLIFGMPLGTLRLYVALSALLIAWFALIHLVTRVEPDHLPKELMTGFFFAAALFIPTISRAPWMRSGLLPAALWVALLCSLNCLYIYRWEHEAQPERTRGLTGRALHALQWLTILGVLGPLCFASLGHAPLLVAASLASGLLLVLDRFRSRVSRTHLRALADLVLLTPVLMLPFCK